MRISIFLLCYNEEILIEKTIQYYRERFPSSSIIIVDNCSTDRSVQIAIHNNCDVMSFNSGNQQNEAILLDMRNNVWKVAKTGWIIMADMDEWLNITEKELEEEEQKGTTIITTKGYNIIGNSRTKTLDDINLFELKEGVYDENMSKRVLFKLPDVDICYGWGAHKCNPKGNIVYSEKEYILKHMNWLGEEYIIEKYHLRTIRNQIYYHNNTISFNGHYFTEKNKLIEMYREFNNNKIKIIP